MQHLSAHRTPEVRSPAPAATATATAAAVLLSALAKRGLRVAFGIAGGSISPVFDALASVPEIQFIATRHETIAAFAAMGYARATGLPALVLVTSGPGITNAMTGVAAAYLEELPLILVGGDVATPVRGRHALQDGSSTGIDTVAMLRTITRWSTAVTSPDGVTGVAERAWSTAQGPSPGPVFLSFPLDLGTAAALDVPMAFGAKSAQLPDPAACGRAANELAQSKRPLLVLGNGARSATQQALALAERLAMPVIVTPHAKGLFPERHPLYLGLIGAGQHPSAVRYLAERPDVSCIVGSRLGDIATNGWSTDVGGSAATIQIDRDPWLVGKNVRISLGIVGDAAPTLEAILAALPTDVAQPVRSCGGCRSVRAEAATSDAVPLKPQRVLAALAAAFPDAIWCCDIGEHLTMALHYLRVDDPLGFHAMTGLGSMGSGIGMALGIQRARPNKTVVCVCGDGGMSMHAGEILTCVESGLQVVFAVFNDGLWNMVEHGFRAVYGRAPASLPRQIADLARVASGFGALGVTVRKPEHLDVDRLRDSAASGRPVVLDIRIDPNESLSRSTRSAALQHFAHGNLR